jgi:adenylate cyclase
MNTAASETVYRFEGFVLDLARGALLDAKGVEAPLRAKSFDLLCLFVTNAGRLLDREAINQAIWSNVVVTDDAITQCVRDIRRAIGDVHQRILKTVPRRGYIFTATVTTGGQQPLTVPTDEPLPLPDKPSIAVLPFANLSGDPEQEYFSEGLAVDIITALSRSRSLFVIARNSSFTYRGQVTDVKQIRRELAVRYVVEGSVRRAAGRIRVNAQLIDAETGSHMWAERYDRALEDVFAVQDEITEALTTAINPAIADAELRRALRKPPENLGAWEAYQRGLWHASKATATDIERALEFFSISTKLDTTFASPHAMLAYFYGWGFARSGIRRMREIIKVAGEHARRAVQRDANDPTALAALSWLSKCDGDIDGALELVERAILAAPSDAVAWIAKARVLQFSGRAREALVLYQTALRLSPIGPTNWIILGGLMISHYFERDYSATVGLARRTIRDYPELVSSYRWLAAALGQLGRHHEAFDALQRAIEVSPVSFKSYVRSRLPWFRPEDHKHMLDGLRRAGWQGGDPKGRGLPTKPRLSQRSSG